MIWFNMTRYLYLGRGTFMLYPQNARAKEVMCLDFKLISA